MLLVTKASLVLSVALLCSVAHAHEVKQRLGGYKASNGETRSEGGIGGTLQHGAFGTSAVSSATYGVDASVEKIVVEETDDKYMLENFPDGERSQKTASLSTTHTFSKLTDVRAGGSWSSDNVTSSKSWSGGIGRWWHQDSVQTNIDFSRTVTDKPTISILDLDRETVVLSPNVTSGGATFSVKHLATPTTIWGASYTRVEASDRPRLDAYGVNLKQFIPAWTASVHSKLTRIINTGPVTLETTSGSMAGLQAELALLKSMWRGANARAAYRYAREDEETRAYGDHVIYGADSYSLGLSQDIGKGPMDRPLTAHAVATSYKSNTGVTAVIGEAGLAVKF